MKAIVTQKRHEDGSGQRVAVDMVWVQIYFGNRTKISLQMG